MDSWHVGILFLNVNCEDFEYIIFYSRKYNKIILRIWRNLCVRGKEENIIAKAQTHLQNSFSVKLVCCAIHKCRLKLYHAKKNPHVNMIQKHCHLLWAKANLKWTVKVGKLICGQTH